MLSQCMSEHKGWLNLIQNHHQSNKWEKQHLRGGCLPQRKRHYKVLHWLPPPLWSINGLTCWKQTKEWRNLTFTAEICPSQCQSEPCLASCTQHQPKQHNAKNTHIYSSLLFQDIPFHYGVHTLIRANKAGKNRQGKANLWVEHNSYAWQFKVLYRCIRQIKSINKTNT